MYYTNIFDTTLISIDLSYWQMDCYHAGHTAGIKKKQSLFCYSNLTVSYTPEHLEEDVFTTVTESKSV